LKFTYALDYIPDGYCIRFHKTLPESEIVRVLDINSAFHGFRSAYSLYKKLKEQLFSEPILLTNQIGEAAIHV
jgi:hypothetical protein